MKSIPAKALHRDSETGTIAWKDVLINHTTQPMKPSVDSGSSQESSSTVSRIQLCFDVEDPRKFAKRVASAYQQRIHSDSLIGYNYYIDNMPIQDLNDLIQSRSRDFKIYPAALKP